MKNIGLIHLEKVNINNFTSITGLKIGDYYLKETKGDALYYLLKDDIKVSIEYNKTTTKVIENELKKGRIRVIKVDSEDNEIKLKGVKFEVLDENDNILEEIITNENGEAVTSKYAIRDFSKLKIREKETLENYILTKEIRTIELEENLIKDIIFENEKVLEPTPEPDPDPVPEIPKLPRTGM